MIDMDNNIDSIKDTVNEYMQQNKIAVFVGAGVSTLSNYPSWSKLILSMAKQIGYPISLMDKKGNPKLSSDEYLKIPQMFFENKGEREYIKTVRKQLHIIKEPNEIHKMIMNLNPNHILTTNYDTLIEQAANRAGRSFSVINSDDKVATAPTRNFILKLHGDFEINNFVLKEQDYLNYEENFKLIDNLMKSIISTHLVIFVGYGLGDYNIKLILNWVKQVQKDSFIEPVFIYTDDHELSDMELTYYQGEHLKVIDANKLVDNPEQATYKDRYIKAMTSLIDTERSEKWYRNETWTIDHFYKIIRPLDDVRYLRALDIASLFPESKVFNYTHLNWSGIKYLFQAYDKKERLSTKRSEQLERIIRRFFNSGIESICDTNGNENDELNSKIHRGTIIDNDTFDMSYQDICGRIEKYGNDIESQYDKAYDLYRLGRLNDSIEVYYQLLADCYTSKRWILYFFTQINLFYLRQTIIHLNRDLTSIWGAFYFGKSSKLWEDEEIRDVELSHTLTDIPAEIKRYVFFQKLTAKNYYLQDSVQFIQDNYEIEKAIAKQQYTVAGRTKDQNSKIKIFDAINFIYGNKITFDRFFEHKTFVKVAMQQRLKGMISQNELSSNHIPGGKKRKSYISFQESLLLIRNFTYDDLSVFFEKENGNKLFLVKDRKFDKYLRNLIAYFEENFVRPISDDRKLEYITLKNEMKNALYLASYFADNDDTIILCLDYLFHSLSYDELEIYKRIPLLERFKEHMTDSSGIRIRLEKDISERIQICNDNYDKPLLFEKDVISSEVNALIEWFEGYKSELIKNAIESSLDSVSSEIKPLIKGII